MDNTCDLLIEIGTEELPPKELFYLSTHFAETMQQLLQAAAISFTKVAPFAAPRRIALFIESVASEQPTQIVEKKGPPLQAAFDQNNNPTKAAVGFAKTCAVTLEDLTIEETPHGKWLIYRGTQTGQKTATLLPDMFQEALRKLPVKKRMRWGNNPHPFVRPVHWIICLFGQDVVPFSIFGIKSQAYTFGHRFLANEKILISEPKLYASLLKEQGKVIACFEARKELIRNQIQAKVQDIGIPVLNEALLDEVTNLVEWPVVLVGTFDKIFLQLPKDALISTLEAHQKCFAVTDKNHNILPYFVITSNIESTDPNSVIKGNEKVIHARLRDADFHFKHDKKISPEGYNEKLKQVVFQKSLGSLFDKVQRVALLAKSIAEYIQADPIITKEAALLSKFDLMTNMVYEFPELQGIMGYEYALAAGKSLATATAIVEHYLPRFADDKLPETFPGICVALADRLDSLVGLFSINKIPTGDKDPFALRRQALGILRIILEKNLDLNLIELISIAQKNLNPWTSNPSAATQVYDFFIERLKSMHHAQNLPAKAFESVAINKPQVPLDFQKRLYAVVAFQALPEAESLANANKRVHNILNKNKLGDVNNITVQTHLFKEPAESSLFNALNEKQAQTLPLIEQQQYSEALKILASLKEPIDAFFDTVMVMCDDKALQQNRLALLQQLRTLFLKVADISLLS